MHAKITLSADIKPSARALQVASLMDIAPENKLTRSWDVTLPIEEKPWNVGLIVGPSGSGKSTLAGQLWPGRTTRPHWGSQPILDEMPDMPVRDITGMFTAVGLSSVPTWLRPHGTLSTGEQFRADLARLLAETPSGGTTVIDEFTSVVDRQVATAASHCLQKTARRQNRQVVAVTCHYDVLDWLVPDWVLDVPTSAFRWEGKRRHPPLDLEIRQVSRSNWPLFKNHHYLSAVLPPGAVCYGTFAGEEMICFSAVIRRVHRSPEARRIWVMSRQVTLPDWQGMGIGTTTGDWIAQHYVKQGWRFRWLTAHPGLIAHFRHSPQWRMIHNGSAHQIKSGPNSMMRGHQRQWRMMAVACFEYKRRAPLPVRDE
jgi:energy-coupling factor transporter ATP-binding protein EcfA2